MVTRRVTAADSSKTVSRKSRPATTPQARENQLIALADSLAERQLRDGTASSQVISHYLKLGSSREALEQQRLAGENQLILAKIEAMASAVRIEELYGKAITAMKSYSGAADSDEVEFDD